MSFLQEHKTTIINEIEKNGEYLRNQNMLFRAFNGNLEPLFEERLAQVHSETMRNNMRAHQSLPNYYQKCVKKISGIYDFEIEREFSSNQELFNWYIENMSPDLALAKNNEATNALRASLIEIYYKQGFGIKLRTIPMDRFWVWTNDPEDPNEPKVYVKLINDIDLTFQEKRQYNQAKRYYMYTDEEFLATDVYDRGASSRNKAQYDFKNERAEENDLGFAPFVYISYDDYNLIPEIDTSSMALAIGPGFDLTNASVAGYFQAFPIRYVINGPEDLPANLSINPDDLVQLRGEEGSDVVPEFGELASSLDLNKILELVKFKVEDYMYTKDCPVKKDAVADKSGLSLMIESTDTLENKKRQINYYKTAEKELWNKIAKYHNWLMKNKPAELDEDTPKKYFDEKRIKVKVEFQLPSVEVEQAQEVKGNGKEVSSSKNEMVDKFSKGEE